MVREVVNHQESENLMILDQTKLGKHLTYSHLIGLQQGKPKLHQSLD
jgi:hypothetical protein